MKKNYKIYEAYRKNSVGVWYFLSKEGAFKKGKPCKGFGSIKYNEGSVYTGDIYYDGEEFHKIGFGKQDFSNSTLGMIVEPIHEKKYLFVGKYDYRKTDWIYGNGVLYYVDEEGHPSHFIKGFFSGIDCIGGYQGAFDYSLLLEGYTPEMEFDFDEYSEKTEALWEKNMAKIDQVDLIDTLFIGDSYFEFFDIPEFAGMNLFSKLFPINYVNIGIGGAQYSNWILWIDRIKEITKPKRIVINLGFNDIHSGKSVKRVYSEFRKLLKLLNTYFPDTKIICIQILRAPLFKNYYEIEDTYNEKMLKMAKRNHVEILDWNDSIKACVENCFHVDEVHPNEKGYEIFADVLKKTLMD